MDAQVGKSNRWQIWVGIGYTGPCPIVTKFIPVMPQITLITNLVLVCGADVPFFFGNFFKTFFRQLFIAIPQQLLRISKIPLQIRIPRTRFCLKQIFLLLKIP